MLADFAAKGLDYNDVASIDDVDLGSVDTSSCLNCSEHAVDISLCFVEWRDVCEECHGVNDQETILPCEAANGCITEQGMFHASCMVKVGASFLCKLCFEAGATPENGPEESEEEEELDEESSSSGKSERNLVY